jgi:hypothetical protein
MPEKILARTLKWIRVNSQFSCLLTTFYKSLLQMSDLVETVPPKYQKDILKTEEDFSKSR